MKKLRFKKKAEPVRQTSDTSSADAYSFRRSRTITGSLASEVSSAAEQNGQLRSSRLQEHDLRHHRRRLMVYLIIVAVAAWFLWQSVYNFVPRPSTVRLTNGSVVATMDTYTAAAARYLDSRPLTRFYPVFDQDEFSASMTSSLPEIAAAQLGPSSRGILRESELIVTPAKAVAVWNIGGTQFYVDENGRSFKTNLGSAPIVSVNDRSGLSPELGALASTKLLRYIGRVVTLVNASGVATVESVELPPNSTREVVLHLKDISYPVRTHSDRDPAGQAADVASALRFMKEFGIVPQYLDVRVASKAFYR